MAPALPSGHIARLQHLYHFDGVAWTSTGGATAPAFRDVWATRQGEAWAVGAGEGMRQRVARGLNISIPANEPTGPDESYLVRALEVTLSHTAYGTTTHKTLAMLVDIDGDGDLDQLLYADFGSGPRRYWRKNIGWGFESQLRAIAVPTLLPPAPPANPANYHPDAFRFAADQAVQALVKRVAADGPAIDDDALARLQAPPARRQRCDDRRAHPQLPRARRR